MHMHVLWFGVLLSACAASDVERALPVEAAAQEDQALRTLAGVSVERAPGRTPGISVERAGSARVPPAPRQASDEAVRQMEREFEAQKRKPKKHRSAKELEALLWQIVDTPPGRERQRLLGEYALDANHLGAVGERRALARANEVLEGHGEGPQ